MSPRRSKPPRGMALIMVMGALALIALVAARYAQRIDDLRRQTGSLRAHAEQSLQTSNALAAALYYTATRRIGPAGFGPPLTPELRADNREYSFPDGGQVRVQDQRGLMPLNAVDNAGMTSVLKRLGVVPGEASRLVDVLEDYIDTDNLKRLNGAEAPEYAAAGLPPPRNDFIGTARELARMPGWRDTPQVVAALEQWATPTRRLVVNPNTAPIELLAAWWPWAAPEQLELLRTLRESTPFGDGIQASRATGLPLDRDDIIFHAGAELRITVSATGSSRALQYNVVLTPGGRSAPWSISHMQAVSRLEPRTTPDPVNAFPLAIVTPR